MTQGLEWSAIMFVPGKKPTAEHLKELTDEVNEFHPILNVLFRKIPGINRVFYTQGNSELGADFLLERNDPALLKTTWVGVVVKVGLVRQNTSEIERQIKECFISRRIPDGEEIQIREVWVVASNEISRNAREVVSKLYDDKKVEFVGAQDLAAMIDRFAPEAFVTTSPALQNFADELISKLEADDQRSLVVQGMDSFYVEPNIGRIEFDGYGNPRRGKRLNGIDDLLAKILSSQMCIVEAGPGGGKSKLARELVRRVIERQDFTDGLLIPISEHVSALVQDPIAEIEARIAKLPATADGRKVIVFVDGFDEIDLTNDGRKELIDHFLNAAAGLSCSVVILSRPFDRISILGAKAQSMDVFSIEPLKGEKALSFLSKMSDSFSPTSKLARDLNKSFLMRALEGTPIAYILLGRLVSENQQDLPSNLTELFQKYVELVLGRWEVAKGLRSQQEYEVLVELLTWMSSYLLDNKIPEIAKSEAAEWVSQYCHSRNIKLESRSLIEKVCSRNSILYLRAETDTLGFRHRAFGEFFYAKKLSRKPSIDLDPEIFSPYWFNSYYFLAGVQKDCPDLLKSLLHMDLDNEGQEITRALNFGNLLLAGYLTPISVSTESLKSIALSLSKIYVSACDPLSKSALTQLPTIQVLCALTAGFRAQYGYKHFQESLAEAIYSTECLELCAENAVALLFLDVAYKEAGGDLKFDSLIERFGEALPVVVKLALRHEADRMKETSDRLKRMERNLRRTFRANKNSKVFLDRVYKIPVRSLEGPLI